MTATVEAVRSEKVFSYDEAREQRHRICEVQSPLFSQAVDTRWIIDGYGELLISKLYGRANNLLCDAITAMTEDGELAEANYRQFEDRLAKLKENVRQYFEEQCKSDNPVGVFQFLHLDTYATDRALSDLHAALRDIQDNILHPARMRLTLLDLEKLPIRTWTGEGIELKRDERGHWIDGRAAS